MPLPKDKKKFALWLHPQTLEEISEAYAADNCRSKSEFIEKAVKFYLAHLDAQNESSVLPNAFLSTMKGNALRERQPHQPLAVQVHGGTGHDYERCCGKLQYQPREPFTAARRMRAGGQAAERRVLL